MMELGIKHCSMVSVLLTIPLGLSCKVKCLLSMNWPKMVLKAMQEDLVCVKSMANTRWSLVASVNGTTLGELGSFEPYFLGVNQKEMLENKIQVCCHFHCMNYIFDFS